ncbi:serine hydrolase [Mycolicibacterium sp. HK-90]|uniref:serine hydrolase domain-containing protein n=1 Tax=Mycolicibacterium sp. HK-90 TaxID=3056937 RepID=UPI00265B442E|nr:serine hydrolase domain-containing protein [Mycolicibacterium sp. HK-90]WKG03914.1 serine hydrolase domain-containing protein [Mycolicibacterium sp. HK-90]
MSGWISSGRSGPMTVVQRPMSRKEWIDVGEATRRQVILGAAAAAAAVGVAACSPTGGRVEPDAVDEASPLPEVMRNDFRRLTDAQKVRGCSVAAVTREGTVVADAWGLAREGLAMTPASTLNIGSVTKTVTATAVLQLVAAGRIDLDADVNDVLAHSRVYGPRSVRSPYHPDVPITVRHLIAHLTPIDSPIEPGPYGYSYRVGPVADPAEMGRWLHDFLTPTPRGWTYSRDNFTKAVPGQSHLYSDIAYDLAGHVVQAVTGQFFADYCRDAILRPAGMTRSDFNRDRLAESNRAHPHAWFDNGVKRGMWPDYRNLIPHDIPDDFTGHVEYAPYTSCLLADGGLRSNAFDLARWVRMWLGQGTIDGTEVLEKRWAVAALSDQVSPNILAASDAPLPMISQGFAWHRVDGDAEGVWQHAGSEFGTASYVMLDTKRGVGAAVVCNTELALEADPRATMLHQLMDVAARG